MRSPGDRARNDAEIKIERGPEIPFPIHVARSLLEKGVPVRFRARGFSMKPLIRDEDVITLGPLDPAALRMGDVVACVPCGMGRLVVHRVVGRGPDSRVLVRGDGAFSPDGHVSTREILGRVMRVERSAKRVLFGLGPERRTIAWLSRTGVMVSLARPLWLLVKGLMQRVRW